MKSPASASPSHCFPYRATTYLAREYLVSFLVAFIFFFIVFLINQVLLLAEDILSKNVSFSKTMLLLLYSLPSVLALAFPFASLAGALMAAARLNADNELLAFSAGGVSLSTLYLPFVVIGLAIALGSFIMNDYFLPLGSREFQKVYRDLLAESASLELEPYSVKKYPDTTLITGAPRDKLAGDVLIFQSAMNAPDNVMSAKTANIAMSVDQSSAEISLEDIWFMQVAPGSADRFSVSTADSVLYRLDFREPLVGFSTTGPSDMASGDLRKRIKIKEDSLESRKRTSFAKNSSARAMLINDYSSGADVSDSLRTYKDAKESVPADRSLQIYKLEYHKKYAIPAAGFFFALLAFPLGIGSRKAGRTAGFGIALILSVVYWGMLFAGQTWGLKSQVAPWLSIWAPNFLVLAATLTFWGVRHFSARRLG
jgi:lipopolysaccharide export system permease protein